jgi:hypothetical protein
MRLKANIGKPGEMQHRPEAITAAKEVVTGGRSGRGRDHQKLGGPPPRSKRRLRDHSALLKQIGEPGPPAAGIRLPRISGPKPVGGMRPLPHGWLRNRSQLCEPCSR